MPRYEDYAEYYDLDHGGDFDIGFYREYAEVNGPRVLELRLATHVLFTENIPLYSHPGWLETGRDEYRVYMRKSIT